MTKRLFKTLCVALTMLSASVPAAFAYSFKVGNIYYELSADRKSATVTYANLGQGDYSGDVFIPYEVNYQMQSYPVKKIGDFAFTNSQGMNSIVISEGVTSIGQQAFSHCYYLTSVTLPSTLRSLLDYAFEYCEDLPQLHLPKALRQINEGAFYDCLSIREFTIDEENTSFRVSEGAIYTADGKEFVQYPCGRQSATFSVDEGTEKLRGYSFANTRLETLFLPSTLTSAEDLAFVEAMALRSVYVLAAVPPVISEEVFEPAAVAAATLYVMPEAVEAYGSAPGWRNFRNIKAIDSAAEGIVSDTAADAAVYTVTGVKVADSEENAKNLPAGIYVSRGNTFLKKH